MTEKKANELFEKWRKVFHLESWEIVFQWCVRRPYMNDSEPDSMGCTTFDMVSRQAIIQMLDPVDFHDGLFSYDYEKTLVHELLHIKFAELDYSGDTLRDNLTHQMVNDLAKAFVAVSREVDE